MSIPIAKQLQKYDRPRRREMSRTERIIAFYTHDVRLTEQQEAYRQALEAAHAQMVSGKTRAQITKFLQKRHGIKQTKCYQVIKDSIQVFGDINKSSKEGLRHIQTERYTKIARQLIKDGKHEEALIALTRIDKINQLEKASSGTSLKKILQPKTLIFTTDESALALQRERERLEAEAEDIDHEEV